MKLYSEGSRIILEIEDSDVPKGMTKEFILEAYLKAILIGFAPENRHLISEIPQEFRDKTDIMIADLKEKHEVIEEPNHESL